MDLEEITEELQKKKKVKKFLKKKKDQLWTYYLDKSEFYVPIVIWKEKTEIIVLKSEVCFVVSSKV